LDNIYKQIHEDLREASREYTLVDGMLEVHKSEEGHYIIKNVEPYISMGVADIDLIMEDIKENELDEDYEWSEGLYEFSYLVSYREGEYDNEGHCTSPDYYEILSEEYALLTTFEQMERDKKLNEILDQDLNEIFDF
jgi:hypothetical protein